MNDPTSNILDSPAISGCYLFPQPRQVRDPFCVEVDGATLACYHKVVNPDGFTVVHFHGNGEAVADYVPDFTDALTNLGLNSLFVEYREYGGSTGQAQLVAMGVNPADAIQRIASLNDAELNLMTEKLDQLPAGGDAFLAVIGIRTGFTLYLDIAIALGLVGFLATVAFARFILSRGPAGETSIEEDRQLKVEKAK